MKGKLLLILIYFVCIISSSCNIASEKKSGNTIKEESDGKYLSHSLFDKLLFSSDFPFPDDIDKKDIHTLFDNKEGSIYTYKVYFETEGTGTIGWVKYDVNCNILYDVTGDAVILPRILTFDEIQCELFLNSLDHENTICPTENKTLLPFEFLEWLDWQEMIDMTMYVDNKDRYFYYPISNNYRLNYYYNFVSGNEEAYKYFNLDCGKNYDCYLIEIGYKGISTQYKLLTITKKNIISEILVGDIREKSRLIFIIDDELKVKLFEEDVEYNPNEDKNIIISSKLKYSYQIQDDGKIVKID